MFLDLPKIEGELRKWIDSSSVTGEWAQNGIGISYAWLNSKEGLRPRCITRDLKWGVPVPLKGFEDKVFYVWFDAPIGYISITATYTEHWEKWWKNPQQVQLYQFMAKDNVPFHTIIFPSSLIAAQDNYTLLHHVNSTDYLNYEDGKFSKSRGIGVFGNDVMSTGIPSDIWRFYLLSVRPETQDSAFAWSDFVSRNNSELLNNLGNFVNRALSFVKNTYGGRVPKAIPGEEEGNLGAHVTRCIKEFNACLEKVRLREGLRVVLGVSRLGNQYMQQQAPWKLVKEGKAERAATAIAACVSCVHLLATLLHPYMPTTADQILLQLNALRLPLLDEHFRITIPEGHSIGEPKPLFAKIEPSVADELKKRFAGTQAQQAATAAATTAKSQSAASPSPAPASASSPVDIATIEAEVNAQGEKVRKLKAEKADKKVVDAEVASLLALKGKLTAAKSQATAAPTTSPAAPAPASAPASASEVAAIEAEVNAQGEKVRKLKAEKADKKVVDAEVASLLALKGKLTAAKSQATAAPTTSPAAPAPASAPASASEVAAIEAEVNA
eukprot:Opistho-2@22748